MLTVDVPGDGTLDLEHMVLDINGTLTDRGELIEGVAERLQRLAAQLEVHLVTADTFGTAQALGARLRVSVTTIASGEQKAAYVVALGADSVAAIGNGLNDAKMLRASRLGVAVIGPEGAASGALVAADVVCRSITEALDLLLDERALAATLRS